MVYAKPPFAGPEAVLAYLSRYDGLTNEMNRWHMTAVLEATIEEAVKLRSSCGFMLAAIDNLGRINEAYGFNIADEVIAAVATRIRSQMRGKDHLGRFSGNKFGLILKNCTPDECGRRRRCWSRTRLVVQTSPGRCGAVTHRRVTAPRTPAPFDEVLRVPGCARLAKASAAVFQVYRQSRARRAAPDNVRATDESSRLTTALFRVTRPVVRSLAPPAL